MRHAHPRVEQPLSPHLQIYRPIISMVMSIFHRITGAALYFGSLLLAWWFTAAASGEAYFQYVNSLFGSIPGQLILLGFTWALFHHALGGIRHFIWDSIHGFERPTINLLSWGTLAGSVSLTAIIWAIALLG